MPTLINTTEIKLDWADIDHRRKRKPHKALKRSSGVHLSGIIRYAHQQVGMLKMDEDDEFFPLRMAIGMAWEEWAIGLWPDIVWQPGEWEVDGVFGTPDGSSRIPVLDFPVLDYLEKGLEEFKATWKSEHTHGKDGQIVKESLWMWQLAGNCHAYGYTLARLHVLWMNGDYRPPSPKYMVYTIRFTPDELSKFWQNVVLKNKDKAAKEQH